MKNKRTFVPLAHMADGTDPPGPGDGHTDPNTLPPRQEGGGLSSRREEGSQDQDLQEEEEVKETYFSPREPSPGEDSSDPFIIYPYIHRYKHIHTIYSALPSPVIRLPGHTR